MGCKGGSSTFNWMREKNRVISSHPSKKILNAPLNGRYTSHKEGVREEVGYRDAPNLKTVIINNNHADLERCLV